MPALLLLLLVLFTSPLRAGQAADARIEVASNFAPAIKKLAQDFLTSSGRRLQLAFGSSGKHYAQIRHGAPFDAFFSADTLRAQRLEEEGRAIPGSRFTYAIGRLLLWSSDPALIRDDSILDGDGFRHLAMANPKLAPYGAAAREFLRASGRERKLKPRLIFGENIGQTFHFIASGNAELGFIAAAQIQQPGRPRRGSWWPVPEQSHAPIRQQALLLRDNPAAREFLAFVRSSRGRAIIRAFGYRLPPPPAHAD